MSEETPSESTPPKPSITPAAKPKFKVTQSPFAPRIRHYINPEKPSIDPRGESIPKPSNQETPKPQGVKPVSLAPAEHKVEPSAGKHIPGAAHTPHKPLSAPKIRDAQTDSNDENVPAEENDTDENTFVDFVHVGLQGVAAIAAIAFTALAVIELYPFL
ncbi:MAG: hypothetical protein HRU10_05695 [Opitutales bacterium]|nr:hypothetical protein [Opitutales bacterium]